MHAYLPKETRCEKKEKRAQAQGLGIALLGTFTAFSLGDNRLGAISAVTFFAPVLKSFELVAAASARRSGIRTFDRALLILSVAPTLSAIVQCKFMAVLLAGRLRSALGVGTTGPAKDRLKAFRSSA